MPILLAGTLEIVHIEQVSALFTFRLGQVVLYYHSFLSLNFEIICSKLLYLFILYIVQQFNFWNGLVKATICLPNH
jgi:hypothetical protein